MQRVLVIGPCGSGKSSFARALAPLLDLPLVHWREREVLT